MKSVKRVAKIVVWIALCLPFTWQTLRAQSQYYLGGVGAISTLSGDGRTALGSTLSAISSYNPRNGPAVNLFVGRHLSDYLSLQANYMWNRNELTLDSANFSPQSQSGYQQLMTASQYGFVGELLFYFRDRRSRIRPYLSAGPGVYHTTANALASPVVVGSSALPPPHFASTNATLRVVAGADMTIRPGWAFRYNFSENIGGNPISPRLSPPGQRVLRNFQNMFGVVRTFGEAPEPRHPIPPGIAMGNGRGAEWGGRGDEGKYFVGSLAAFSVITPAGATIIQPPHMSASGYKPENGPALSFFAGRHLNNYLSLQGDYIWNRNNLTMVSTSESSEGRQISQSLSTCSQHALLADLLVYVRNRRSFWRPYLSAGTGVVYMNMGMNSSEAVMGSPMAPPRNVSSFSPAAHLAVGIDLTMRRGWAFRYTYGQIICHNSISMDLAPSVAGNLSNFHNLFGFVKTF